MDEDFTTLKERAAHILDVAGCNDLLIRDAGDALDATTEEQDLASRAFLSDNLVVDNGETRAEMMVRCAQALRDRETPGGDV